MKTLENVHPDEVGNIGTRSLTRQEDGGDVGNLDSGNANDLDVSYDCELNLNASLNQLSFNKFLLMMS